MSTVSYLAQRRQLIEAANRLFTAAVMSHSGHGNLSVRLPEPERLLLTAGGHIHQLTPEQFVVVTFDGEVVEGAIEAVAREIVGMHAGVYRERPDVQAVIHTHSPRATSFAVANKPLPVVYEAFLRFGIVEAIPVAEWAPRGSAEAVANIREQLRLHPGIPALLLGNHGLLAFGADPAAAAQPFPTDALDRERAHMQRFRSA